jgi:hypothetical protein
VDLTLGSTISPSNSPSGEVTMFSSSHGAAVATDRLTVYYTVDVWLASVLLRAGGSTTAGLAEMEARAGDDTTEGPADVSGGGDEIV